MKSIGKRAQTYLLVIGVGFGLMQSVYAGGIVASGSTLDIDNGNTFNVATITIVGPNNFNKQFHLYAGETRLQIDELGITESGNYSYHIQYTQQGKIEYISDASTGRQSAPRNTGKIQSSSGYFNVLDGEFITEEIAEANPEMKTERIQSADVSELNSNVSNVAESSAERHQGQ